MGVIDREARDRLALHVRRLAAGRISTDQFDSRAVAGSSHDLAIDAIFYAIDGMYGDLWPSWFRGSKRLTSRWRTYLARCVLFLRSNIEYRWPSDLGVIPWKGPMFAGEVDQAHDLNDLLGMRVCEAGCARRERYEFATAWRKATHAMGPARRAWPFRSSEDLKIASDTPTYLCGSRRLGLWSA